VYAPFLAPLIIVINIVKVTVIGLGVVKDEGVVNSMTRHGDYRCIYAMRFLFFSFLFLFIN
jgi:farnesol kinase